jgi:tRNA-dihydrouridine synthase
MTALVNFWNTLPRPIVGLSPMDGVTDASFRRIAATYGKPDLTITEFASVEGICHGAESELRQLLFSEVERPVIAQIYGAEPEAFFHVAQLVCDLGFDGIDINMGCPAKKVSARGCGAGLIKDPARASAILQETRRGIAAWADGAPLSILKRHPKVADWYAQFRLNKMGAFYAKRDPLSPRQILPVSLKTRLGIDQVVIREWVEHLLKENPAAISIHGRTLTQRYRGTADWDAISEAVETARGSGTLILGNGDILSLNDAALRIRQSGVDGVLIGRAALGNPWIFRKREELRRKCNTPDLKTNPETTLMPPDTPVTLEERFHVALEHAKIFQETCGVSRFVGLRKHLGWYCRGFPGARALRAKIVRVNNLGEIETLLNPHLGASRSIKSSTAMMANRPIYVDQFR